MKLINPMKVIDGSRIHSFHIWLVFWLFLVILFDGYDVVIYGAVVPSLIKEWGISDVTARTFWCTWIEFRSTGCNYFCKGN
ncbi:hypothetical protein BS1321_07285 [Peribacillus simplex NBRC 15720 = DSM 1321]|uniref:Uncharacterized protein n=1 Tax=Peribacillus simplex NBRC 15720 = DSM 1321 TaxID=1349754 RepID=A0A223EEY4_9BACI|nr:hypothetical protein [Peribacillus simplex]ASS93791.1 hypothetical protein BS1321_07285 [Peribacillus simplex NBRC 15720 = DSM 1321]